MLSLQLPEVFRKPFLDAIASSQIRAMKNTQVYAQPLHPPGTFLVLQHC